MKCCVRIDVGASGEGDWRRKNGRRGKKGRLYIGCNFSLPRQWRMCWLGTNRIRTTGNSGVRTAIVTVRVLTLKQIGNMKHPKIPGPNTLNSTPETLQIYSRLTSPHRRLVNMLVKSRLSCMAKTLGAFGNGEDLRAESHRRQGSGFQGCLVRITV